MFGIGGSVRIYYCPTPINLRKSFDGLAGAVEEYIKQDPESGHVFAFFSRNKKLVKLLQWAVSDILRTFVSERITDDKRELAQPKQPTDQRAPEEQVGCEGGASRLFTLYHLRKVCKCSCTAECPILSWKYA